MAFYTSMRTLALFTVLTTAVTCSMDTPKPMMASPSPSNLKVHIVPANTTSTLEVKISNTHKDTPLTILTWDAPFDTIARDSGSYHIQPASPPGADEVPSLGLKVKRMLPVPREDLLEIPPQGHITRELLLKSSWIPADGEQYKVWAKGPWRAVWTKKLQDVTDEDLNRGIGEFGVGPKFETNVAEIKLQ